MHLLYFIPCVLSIIVILKHFVYIALSLLSVPYIIFKANLSIFDIVTTGPQCIGCLQGVVAFIHHKKNKWGKEVTLQREKVLSLQLHFPMCLSL